MQDHGGFAGPCIDDGTQRLEGIDQALFVGPPEAHLQDLACARRGGQRRRVRGHDGFHRLARFVRQGRLIITVLEPSDGPGHGHLGDRRDWARSGQRDGRSAAVAGDLDGAEDAAATQRRHVRDGADRGCGGRQARPHGDPLPARLGPRPAVAVGVTAIAVSAAPAAAVPIAVGNSLPEGGLPHRQGGIPVPDGVGQEHGLVALVVDPPGHQQDRVLGPGAAVSSNTLGKTTTSTEPWRSSRVATAMVARALVMTRRSPVTTPPITTRCWSSSSPRSPL